MRSSHVLTAVLALAMLPAVAAGAPTIAEVSSGVTANSQPTGIAAGPDGNLWFTGNKNPVFLGLVPGLVRELEMVSAPSPPVVAGPLVPG